MQAPFYSLCMSGCARAGAGIPFKKEVVNIVSTRESQDFDLVHLLFAALDHFQYQ